jgi:uncharacterized protein (TIGR02217 family)
MAFFEVEFPTTISYQAVGGPAFSTNVNEAFSGAEQRNRNWAKVRGKWTVSLITPAGMARQNFIDLLESFFLVLGGKADGFRLKDHKDFQAVNQPLIAAPGGAQLAKTYTIGNRSYVRAVTKPITSAIKDYKGNALADTVTFAGGGALDPTTGIITGGTPGALASFQFHHPVRFDTDEFAGTMEEANVAGGEPILSWNAIALLEVRPPEY